MSFCDGKIILLTDFKSAHHYRFIINYIIGILLNNSPTTAKEDIYLICINATLCLMHKKKVKSTKCIHFIHLQLLTVQEHWTDAVSFLVAYEIVAFLG